MNIIPNWRMMLIGMLVLVITVSVRLASHYRDSYHTALDKQRELSQLSQSRLETINTLHEQDTKNRALIAEQIANEQKLRETATTAERRYRNAIQNDTCATVNAPVDVVGILRGTSPTTAHATTAP